MRKNTLLIIVFVFLLVGIVVGWIFFFRSRNSENNEPVPGFSMLPTNNSAISPKTEVSSAPIPQFLKLWDGEVASPAIASKTIVFFDKTHGVFRSLLPLLDVSKEGKLSETVFSNTFSIVLSPNYKMSLIGLYQGQTKRFAVFDFQQNLSRLLPEFVKDAAWSSDSNQLLINHFEPQQETFYFSTANIDGTKESKILEIRLTDAVMFYAPKSAILFYQKPAPDLPSERFFNFDLKTKKLTVVDPTSIGPNIGGFGFDMLPSPSGESIIFSSTDQTGSKLSTFVFNLKTNRIVSTKFSTLVQKCAWTADSEEIICAYSSQITQASGLPFEYWKGKIQSNDSFAKFNLRTGEMKIYAVNSGYDAISLAISPEKDFVVFVSQADQALY